MSRPARIRIDRLVLDGLPAGTTPAAIEQAVRAAFATRLGHSAPARAAVIPGLRLDGRGGSLESAAREVAAAVAGLAGARR